MSIKRIDIVLVGVFLCLGCAPVINQVQLQDSEYDTIKQVKKLLIVTKDGSKHELVQFTLTDSFLVGNEKISWSVIVPVQINLSNIKSISIYGERDDFGKIITQEEIDSKKSSTYQDLMTFVGGLGFGVVAFMPSCAFSLMIAGDKGENSEIATVVFCALELGAIILGGHQGSISGKNTDRNRAVEHIKQERKKERDGMKKTVEH